MKCIWLLVLAAGMSEVVAQPVDPDQGWISYYNGNDGWFAFQGPQRAMRIHPPDFSVEYPLEVESLKVWFYWGMGSWTDSVYTFRIYGNDGQALLWQSESLVAPTSYWVTYGLTSPLKIDSQDFYIAMTYRRVDPYAHPYVNVDDAANPSHSFYGSPGSWTTETVGEFCFSAFVRHLTTGVESGCWLNERVQQPLPTIARGTLMLSGRRPARLLDINGRTKARLKPGTNDIHELTPGIYFMATGTGTRSAKLIIRP
jgi:hypothetical protein